MEELFYNKYRKEGGQPIGKGASAEVWRVTDVDAGIVQALKIYKGMDNEGVQMMRHEFALMANINHQNLLRPMFFGIWEDKPFLVLPFCKNGNINSLRGRFAERDVWKLLRDVAGGLAYLHNQEPPIIHQDIKPANVLVDDNGSFQLTDFGVSAHAKATSRATISSELVAVGTLAYMAPEKFTGDKTIYAESDIWSLGAMAYEMATGDVPFSVGTVEGGSLQLHGASIPELPDTLSPQLCELIYDCLSLNKEDRPTAAEIEEEAIEWLAERPTNRQGETERKNPPPLPEPKPSSWYKRTFAIVMAAVGAIAIIGCIVAFILYSPKEESQMSDRPMGMAEVAAMLKERTTAQKGLKMLQEMADKSDPDAVYLLSRIYFKSHSIYDVCPDSVRVMQRALNISSDNVKAHELLEKSIKLNPDNYYALYEMGCDYLGGDARTEAVSRNIPKADEYFQKALTLANKASDDYYTNLINEQIEKYKYVLESSEN